MVVALCLNVGVCKQEDGQGDGDDIPSREYKTRNASADVFPYARLPLEYTRESITSTAHVPGIVPSRERDHSRDLQKAHLQRIC